MLGPVFNFEEVREKVNPADAGISCDKPINWEKADKKAFQFSDSWQSHIGDRIIVLDNEEMVFRWDAYGRIFTFCVRDMLVLDIDTKYGEGKEKTLEQLERYCDFMHENGVDLLFQILETDKGIHAVLMNQEITPHTYEHMQISIDLCVDIDYIAFSTISGFCQRLTPKVVRRAEEEGDFLYTKEELKREFVAKRGFKGTTYVGYGELIPRFVKYMDLFYYLTEQLQAIYQRDDFDLDYTLNTNRSKIVINGVLGHYPMISPPQEFFDYIYALSIAQTDKLGISTEGVWKYPRLEEQWIDYYDGMLDKNTYYQCGGLTAKIINDRTFDVVIRGWRQQCDWQAVSVGGRDKPDKKYEYYSSKKYIRNPSGRSYPFVFGINGENNLIFVQFPQLFMGDWDVADGYEKDQPAKLVERYFQSEKIMPERLRLFKTYPRFKWYESDNGVHGYCISAPLHFKENSRNQFPRPLELMRRLCIDGWYIAFCKYRGYSIRVGPKVSGRPTRINGIVQLDEDEMPILDDVYFTKEKVESQFIQKDGVPDGKGGRVYYTGEGEADPYLESLCDFIMVIKEKIRTYPNLYERTRENIFELSKDLGEIVKASYDDICRVHEVKLNPYYLSGLNYYAENIWRCPEPSKSDDYNEEV